MRQRTVLAPIAAPKGFAAKSIQSFPEHKEEDGKENQIPQQAKSLTWFFPKGDFSPKKPVSLTPTQVAINQEHKIKELQKRLAELEKEIRIIEQISNGNVDKNLTCHAMLELFSRLPHSPQTQNLLQLLNEVYDIEEDNEEMFRLLSRVDIRNLLIQNNKLSKRTINIIPHITLDQLNEFLLDVMRQITNIQTNLQAQPNQPRLKIKLAQWSEIYQVLLEHMHLMQKHGFPNNKAARQERAFAFWKSFRENPHILEVLTDYKKRLCRVQAELSKTLQQNLDAIQPQPSALPATPTFSSPPLTPSP